MLLAMYLLSLVCIPDGGQFNGNSQDWVALAGNSTAVIVGVAEKQLTVVHPDRMVTTSKPLPDGKVLVELPNRADYVEGRVIRIRIVEVLKRDGKTKANGVISIFVPGATLTDVSPAFEEGQHYLVFLSRLAADPQKFAGATIHHDAPSAWEERFNPKSQYVIVQDSGGLVHLSDQNMKVMDEVRAALLTARL